jgi:hypothetical protein
MVISTRESALNGVKGIPRDSSGGYLQPRFYPSRDFVDSIGCSAGGPKAYQHAVLHLVDRTRGGECLFLLQVGPRRHYLIGH